jgi:hypothetical protein
MPATIPPSAQQATESALNALIGAGNACDDTGASRLPDGDDVGQILEVNSDVPIDADRTVFEDPKSFNVKVRFRKSILFMANCYQSLHRAASTLLFMDIVVRFPNYQGQVNGHAPNPKLSDPSNSINLSCGAGMDG